jgi:hypothetical protein
MAGAGLFLLALTALGDVPLVVGLPDGLLMTGAAALMLWMYASTFYEIGAADLVVRMGPIRRTIPLSAIVEVISTHRFHFMVGVGLAWSLDMLHIRYRKANGRLALPVAMSPEDKEGFLRELAERVPGLSIVHRDGPPPGAEIAQGS